MAFFISRRQVFNNLMHVKQGLDRQQPPSDQDKRIYRAMLNYQTGALEFPTTRVPESPEWKEIQFEVKNKKGDAGFFEAKDSNQKSLTPKEMAPVAWSIMMETIKALNALTAQYPSASQSPEQTAIKCIENEVSSFSSMEALPGWAGMIDRMEAERELKSAPVGTYLFRNGDAFTEVIAKKLSEGNQIDVEVFVCTLVEPENKISDLLILMTSNGWTFYRDNPDLLDSEYVYYDSPEKLLACLDNKLKQPVA